MYKLGLSYAKLISAWPSCPLAKMRLRIKFVFSIVHPNKITFFCGAEQHQHVALCVRFVCYVSFRFVCFVKKNFCLNDQAYNCLIHFYSKLEWKTNFDGRRPLTEDDLWRKTTFDGKRPLTEDDLWWKTTFDGRQPLTEDDLWRKTTFD